MWNGAKIASLIVALCYFPLAIGGYRGFGNKVQLLNHFHSYTSTYCQSTLSNMRYVFLVVSKYPST